MNDKAMKQKDAKRPEEPERQKAGVQVLRASLAQTSKETMAEVFLLALFKKPLEILSVEV